MVSLCFLVLRVSASWCLEPWLNVLCVCYGGQIIKLKMNDSFGEQTVPFSTVKKWIKFWNHQIQTILRLHFTGRIGGMSISEMLRVMCRLQDTICNLCNVRHCDLWLSIISGKCEHSFISPDGYSPSKPWINLFKIHQQFVLFKHDKRKKLFGGKHSMFKLIF